MIFGVRILAWRSCAGIENADFENENENEEKEEDKKSPATDGTDPILN